MRSIIYTAPDSAAAAVVPALGPATPRTTASRASARQSIHRPAVAIVFAAILCWGYTAAWAGIPAEETEPAPRALHQVDEGEHNDERSLELFIEAGVLASKNRHYEAIDKYEQALQLDRSANAIALPLAESFFETSQVDSARSYAESVLGDTTQVAAARRLLARCDLYQGDAEGAIANLRASLDQAPDDQWAFLNLLSLLQRRGKLDEALALLEPAIPENLATAHIYTRRAALRSQLGRHVDALQRVQGRHFETSLHVMLGLPGETHAMMMETAWQVAKWNPHGVKIHNLYVVQRTRLAEQVETGQVRLMEMQEYVNVLADFLEVLPPQMVIERISGDAPPKDLIAPRWVLEKGSIKQALIATLAGRQSYQGSKYSGHSD